MDFADEEEQGAGAWLEEDAWRGAQQQPRAGTSQAMLQSHRAQPAAAGLNRHQFQHPYQDSNQSSSGAVHVTTRRQHDRFEHDVQLPSVNLSQAPALLEVPQQATLQDQQAFGQQRMAQIDKNHSSPVGQHQNNDAPRQQKYQMAPRSEQQDALSAAGWQCQQLGPQLGRQQVLDTSQAACNDTVISQQLPQAQSAAVLPAVAFCAQVADSQQGTEHLLAVAPDQQSVEGGRQRLMAEVHSSNATSTQQLLLAATSGVEQLQTSAVQSSTAAEEGNSAMHTERSDREMALRLQLEEDALQRQRVRPPVGRLLGAKQSSRQPSGTLHAFFKKA